MQNSPEKNCFVFVVVVQIIHYMWHKISFTLNKSRPISQLNGIIYWWIAEQWWEREREREIRTNVMEFHPEYYYHEASSSSFKEISLRNLFIKNSIKSWIIYLLMKKKEAFSLHHTHITHIPIIIIIVVVFVVVSAFLQKDIKSTSFPLLFIFIFFLFSCSFNFFFWELLLLLFFFGGGAKYEEEN